MRRWHQAGGDGPAYAELPLAWAPDEDTAVQAVLEKSSFALTGWKVMAELPNPVNFEAYPVRQLAACRRTGQVVVEVDVEHAEPGTQAE